MTERLEGVRYGKDNLGTKSPFRERKALVVFVANRLTPLLGNHKRSPSLSENSVTPIISDVPLDQEWYSNLVDQQKFIASTFFRLADAYSSDVGNTASAARAEKFTTMGNECLHEASALLNQATNLRRLDSDIQ